MPSITLTHDVPSASIGTAPIDRLVFGLADRHPEIALDVTMQKRILGDGLCTAGAVAAALLLLASQPREPVGAP